MLRLLLVSVIIILITCCKKTNTIATLSGKGTLTGSDTTCGGWLIRESDGTLLEPHNLDSFAIVKKDGDSVIFTYYKTQDLLMICQLGQAIELVSISEP